MNENYRPQHAKQLPGADLKKKKKEYIMSCFISLRYCSSVKGKMVEVTVKCLYTKFGLNTMLCPYLSYIVPEGSRGKMLKQTAGG